MSKPTKRQIDIQEKGERVYRKALDYVYDLKMGVDTPITQVYMEWQKAIRKALQDEGLLLPMIKVDDEWELL